MPATDTPTGATRDRWYRRAAATGHWLRDTGLGVFGVALLALVAAAGWGGSTIGLRDFAATRMGYEGLSAWLVPATFDGASIGLSIVAFRAAIHGRSAPITNIGVIAFTALSSWMNYSHIADTSGRRIAALLPIAGVVLLESLLSEARKAFERRYGKPESLRLHPLRVLFDWNGTWRLWRSSVLADATPATQQVAAVATPAARSNDTLTPATVTATPIPAPRPARATPTGGGGEKVAAMRERFDRYVAEGRLAEITGTVLAEAAGANPSLGRRYKAMWLGELNLDQEDAK